MNAHVLAFQPTTQRESLRTPPEPVHTMLPEREWGLSAGQVAAVVAVIFVVAEVIGALF